MTVILILSATVGGYVLGWIIGMATSMLISLVTGRADGIKVAWLDYEVRRYASLWGMIGLTLGLFGSLSVWVGGNVWTLMLFLPVGQAVESVREMLVGHPPPLGGGCVLAFVMLAIGALLWWAGIWPFVT